MSPNPDKGIEPPFSPIAEILDELRAGRMVILTDDEDRENEGDFILPAQFVTPESVTFVLTEARGYMCLAMTEADCDRLDLHAQSAVNTSARGTPFTVSVDGHPRHGFTTGVSAPERAKTIRMMIDPASRPDDFVRPGHINPLRARDGGVLVRTGQTEGSIDLCKLAGLYPASIVIEIMRDDGEMARVPDLAKIAEKHNIKMCSVAQIIEHRLARQSLVQRLEPAGGRTLRTPEGEFCLIGFESAVDPLPHLALTVGGVGRLAADGTPIESNEPTLVRMHRRDVLGDIFGDLDTGLDPATSSGDQLRAAMRRVQAEGRGAIVYLRPSLTGEPGDLRSRLTQVAGNGTGDADSPALAHLPDGASAMPADLRRFGIGGQILRNLGLSKLRLLSSHAKTMPGLDAFGLEIVETVPL
ncbi:MAG: 3,4-dihydroxy-2-butanone-4-phosphate synthase [Planctomycetota bacterium]